MHQFIVGFRRRNKKHEISSQDIDAKSCKDISGNKLNINLLGEQNEIPKACRNDLPLTNKMSNVNNNDIKHSNTNFAKETII